MPRTLNTPPTPWPPSRPPTAKPSARQPPAGACSFRPRLLPGDDIPSPYAPAPGQHVDTLLAKERCIALLALHASLASKHLAVVSCRLAAVATIFLPISLLAGFWGQNFNVLSGSIEKGWPAFLVLGVGLSAACAGVTVFTLSRRRWN